MAVTKTFTDQSTPGPSGPITARDLDFGDGSSHGTGSGPWTHDYDPGTYTATLTVTGTSPDGTASGSHTFTVTASSNTAPVAGFTWSASGLTVTAHDTSTPGSSGPITAWDLDWGDGSSHATGAGPWTHSYSGTSTHTAVLTVTGTSPDGTDTQSESISVTAPGTAVLNADFTFHAANLAVDFTDTSTPGGGGAISGWDWDFGDGSGPSGIETGMFTTGLGPAPHVQASSCNVQSGIATRNRFPRLKTLRVFNSGLPSTVESGAGAGVHAAGFGMVYSCKPPITPTSAGNTTLTQLCGTLDPAKDRFTTWHEPENDMTGAQFRTMLANTISIAHGVSSAIRVGYTAMAFQWRPGQAKTATMDDWWVPSVDWLGCDVYFDKWEFPALTAAAATLPNSVGFMRWYNWAVTKGKPLLVNEIGCSKEFTESVRATVMDNAIQWLDDHGFVLVSPWNAVGVTGDYTMWGDPSTDFPDLDTVLDTRIAANGSAGSGSTSQNPSHTYASAGTRTVTLKVTSPDGTDSVSHAVQVANAAPLAASFTFSVNNLAVSFTDTSTAGPSGPITGRTWLFGDGNTGTGSSPSHTYATPGTYTVKETVTGTSPDGTQSVSHAVTVTSGGGTPGAFPQRLRTSGRNILDENNHVMSRLKGFNIQPAGWPQSAYQTIYNNGGRVLRLMCFWDQIEPSAGSINSSYITGNLDVAISRAAAAGLYVQLCLYFGPNGVHCPGWVGGSAMGNYVTHGQHVTQYLANRYASNKAVIGLGLNEITPDSTSGAGWLQTLINQQANMVTWMRADAPDWIAFLSSGYGAFAPKPNVSAAGQGPNTQSFDEPTVPFGNYVMTIHVYAMATTSTNTRPVWDGRASNGSTPHPPIVNVDTANYPDIGTRTQCQQFLKAFIAPAKAFCIDKNVPLDVGEWGWIPGKTGGDLYAADLAAALVDAGAAFVEQWDYNVAVGGDKWPAFNGATPYAWTSAMLADA